MKTKGRGSIFRPKFKNRKTGELVESKIWWIAFYQRDGGRSRQKRENSRSENKSDAVRLLNKRVGAVAEGKHVATNPSKVRLSDLADMIRDRYTVQGFRSLDRIEASLTHLTDHFGADCRVIDLTTNDLIKYQKARLAEVRQVQRTKGVVVNKTPDGATINRELTCLRSCFGLAAKAGDIGTIPVFPDKLPEKKRKGFLDVPDFVRLRAALPAHLRDVVEFLYHSAWRRNEATTLEWRDVNLKEGTVTLRGELSKNGEPRVLPLAAGSPLRAIIDRAAANRRGLDCRFVFQHNGQRIGDFRKAWATACVMAGVGKILVHDLRRSGVRNLVRSGVPDVVAMQISGHKTRSVFDRYNIADDKDVKAAMERQSTFFTEQAATAPDHAARALLKAGNE
jgi:integrase